MMWKYRHAHLECLYSSHLNHDNIDNIAHQVERFCCSSAVFRGLYLPILSMHNIGSTFISPEG